MRTAQLIEKVGQDLVTKQHQQQLGVSTYKVEVLP